MSEAIKPKFFNIPALTKTKKSEGPTDEETSLYTMSKSHGWQYLVKIIEKMISDLDKINDTAITSGATFEEIGRNTIVISLVKDIVRKLLNKVNDAKEACESGGGK